MNLVTDQLAALLEQEIAIGDQLLLNLAAQRNALAAWDMGTLNMTVTAREDWLRSLEELEVRRASMFAKQSGPGHLTLRELIRSFHEDSPERQRLESIRVRARETFLRLQADERDLSDLMETLLSHFHAALRPLTSPSLEVYSESGAAAPVQASSTLIYSKV
ncbi:MAG TPA: flagellar export chaperone FlgN [Candidatus Binatia bacterium]|nr:flagellar export chaperone FlgN [Candidatus Binatia bacterium]